MTNQSIKWFFIYTYAFLPLVILYRFTYCWASIRILFYPMATEWLTPSLILIIVDWLIASIFLAFVIYGLHKQRLWGWRLNWLILLGIAVFTGMPPSLVWMLKKHANVDLTLALALWAFVTLVWFWPNFIYFKKRRYLFR